MSTYGKKINGVIEFAPYNYQAEDGTWIINFHLNKKALRKHGYKVLSEEEINEALGIEGIQGENTDVTD